MYVLHFKAAEKYNEGEKEEECNQLPNECNPCGGQVVSKQHESALKSDGQANVVNVHPVMPQLFIVMPFQQQNVTTVLPYPQVAVVNAPIFILPSTNRVITESMGFKHGQIPSGYRPTVRGLLGRRSTNAYNTQMKRMMKPRFILPKSSTVSSHSGNMGNVLAHGKDAACRQRSELSHLPKTLKCRVCGGRYASLSHHMKIHSTENFKHVCPICKKGFRQLSFLKTHMMYISCERTHTCEDCGSRFRTVSRLKLHMVTHTNENNHVCTACGKTFRRVIAHRHSHSGEKIYCCKCKPHTHAYNTQMPGMMKPHFILPKSSTISSHSGNAGNMLAHGKDAACQQRSELSHLPKTVQHLQEKSLTLTAEKHFCPPHHDSVSHFSETGLQAKSIMISHTVEANSPSTVVNTPHSVAPSTSQDGGRGNTLGQGPGGHMECVNGPAASPGLSKSGSEETTLDAVPRMMHNTIVDAMCVQCNVCGRRFLCRKNLVDHMNIHTGEKLYKCSICDKKF